MTRRLRENDSVLRRRSCAAAVLFAPALALAACGAPEEAAEAPDETPMAAAEAPMEAPAEAYPQDVAGWTERLENSTAEIAEDDLAARVAILADDSFAGRAPGTPGGEAASQWIADEMARIGLEPAFDGSYFQTVPLLESVLDTASSSFALTGPDGEIAAAYGEDVVYWTQRPEREVSFEDSEVIFAGYGAVAPEYDWNDYEGFDPAGKTVIVLVNDPGYATGDDNLFTGEAMTYYGRWTYKFEEGGRQGADAVIVVHETAPASYGWNVVRNSWTGPQISLESDAPRTAMEGWVTAETAETLFAAAGLDFAELKDAAARPGFTAVPLEGVTAAAELVTDTTGTESRNVGGLVPGAERPEETVLYTAHWDHLGVDAEAGPGEDAIYNGAVDNATGVAAILEIGEALAARETPPARSVMVLAVTAEESGLLGSDYFAANPNRPLSDIVASINIDAMFPSAPARDMVVVGYGASELEDILRTYVEAEGRVVGPDPNPQAGSFYRSDHISLAKRGVPALYAEAGEDLFDGGAQAGAAFNEEYRDERYHGVADEFDPETWEFSGMLSDLGILYRVGEQLADSDEWPNWYPDNEFRSLRDSQRAGDDGDANGG